MKIIVDDEIPYIKGVLEPYADVEYIPGNLIVRESLSGADALLVRTWTVCDEKLLSGSGVRFVATATAGINHIDTEWCRRNGIITANAPGCNAMGVVQYLFTSLFHVAERKGIVLKGKKLGIIGAGNIGGRAAALAGRFGMVPVVCDPPRAAAEGPEGFCSLDELLGVSDIVTLHVPETDLTKHMIDADAFAKMKDGVFFINASRGTVVDVDALAEALRSKKVAGAAIDVFPKEPASNGAEFVSPLREFDNVILTPHIGAATEEAQRNIGIEVAQKLALYSDNGSTLTAVNFPEVSLPTKRTSVSRLLHVHKNVPGIMQQINEVFAKQNINVAAQYLQTSGDVGYVVMDIHSDEPEKIVPLLKQIDGTLKCRILY